MGGKVWTDNAAGPYDHIIPQRSGLNIGSAENPFDTVFAENVVTAGETLPNTVFLESENAAGSGVIPLIGADATDNSVFNAITGKVGKFAINKVAIGTFDANSIDFPAFNLTDGSDKNYSLTVYAAGTAYTLTAVSAALDFGTTDPVLTINKAGTYLLIARANLELVGATFAANRTVTLKLRRTNNTAADLTSGSTAFGTNVTTTASGILLNANLPAVLYTTTNVNDAITIFGDVSVIPTAGSLQATEASIVAVRLY